MFIYYEACIISIKIKVNNQGSLWLHEITHLFLNLTGKLLVATVIKTDIK